MTTSFPPERLCDVVLEYRGASYRVHRVVMYQNSQVLGALESNVTAHYEEPCVFIPDVPGVEQKDFKALLDCFYYPRATSLAPLDVPYETKDPEAAKDRHPLENKIDTEDKQVQLGLVRAIVHFKCEKLKECCGKLLRYVSWNIGEEDIWGLLVICQDDAWPEVYETMLERAISYCDSDPPTGVSSSTLRDLFRKMKDVIHSL